MVAYLLAAVLLVLFAIGAARDLRRLSNAVLLGLAVAATAAGLLGELDRLPPGTARGVADALPVAALLAASAVAVLLLGNGVLMVRRAGGSPVHLLPLLAGSAGLALIGVLWAAARVDSRPLHAAAAAALLVAGYLAFLLLCCLGYSALYGRIPPPRQVDFVVALGAGLDDDDRVPPLLAARLDRALGLRADQERNGPPAPVLVVSGGKGTGEQLSEAEAMARYAADRGVPAAAVLREDRSRNTAENLRFSDRLMRQHRPDYRCTVVTSNFHVLRTAVEARRAGVPGQVVGAPTAGVLWPGAVLRELGALLLCYPRTNAGAVLLLAVLGATAGWRP
ncbi:YdcF family protein [Kitasatospora sp. DSM 101779]|uniref:YdcF family protein n=1 Tax=Kitasatospora sp. DSM 101779 TaxID=2853165 RepID=UPI0021D9618B|nr:YdcF family protein [Kitasatospora sp. DSM 101779]MCU7820711.1 YdcF family protein [Kitasatospora sp. DSM 101779]